MLLRQNCLKKLLLCYFGNFKYEITLIKIFSVSTKPKSSNAGVDDDELPDDVFKNYDDFYYYDDDEQVEKSRGRRSVGGRRKKSCEGCSTKGKERIDVTDAEYRKFVKFFLEDNPGESCAKAGHAAYSDAVRLQPLNSEPVNFCFKKCLF